MSEKLTVAVIGCGGFAQHFVPLFKLHPYVEKVYCCDIVKERAEKYSEKFEVEIIESFEDVIARNDINTVAIFTQRHIHGDLASRALRAGKNVYSAVPMAISVEDCKKIIDAVKLLRSQYDFGMFKPLQLGAIKALSEPFENVKKQCEKYQKRRDALCGGLRKIGWDVPNSEGTMFVWAPIPPKFKSSREFCMALMEQAGVVCTPGDAFGSLGEGYVRFALVLPENELQKIVEVIDKSGILK